MFHEHGDNVADGFVNTPSNVLPYLLHLLYQAKGLYLLPSPFSPPFPFFSSPLPFSQRTKQLFRLKLETYGTTALMACRLNPTLASRVLSLALLYVLVLFLSPPPPSSFLSTSLSIIYTHPPVRRLHCVLVQL